MLRKPLLLALLIAACSKGPEADLPSIGEARSLADARVGGADEGRADGRAILERGVDL